MRMNIRRMNFNEMSGDFGGYRKELESLPICHFKSSEVNFMKDKDNDLVETLKEFMKNEAERTFLEDQEVKWTSPKLLHCFK